MTMDAALITMTAKRFGCLGVVDESGHLLGIVTDGDLRRAMGPDLLAPHGRRHHEPGARTDRPGGARRRGAARR